MTSFDKSGEARAELLAQTEARLRQAVGQEAVIETVRATARLVCGADGVAFVLREGDLCHYVEEDAIGPLWKGQRFPLSACISGWSMTHAETVVIEDVFADPRIPYDAYRPTFVKSLIMTPVGLNSPVAALGAYWQGKRCFSDSEIGAVKIMGLLMSRALAHTL